MKHKTYKANLEIKNIDSYGVFEGYASVFEITDLHGDIIKKGSFSHSLLNKHCKNIHMLFQHDISKPVGYWMNLEENDSGLFVKGKILQTLPMGSKVLNMIKNNIISGLSIGFVPIITRKDKNVRIIFQADLHEISLVEHPANPQAHL